MFRTSGDSRKRRVLWICLAHVRCVFHASQVWMYVPGRGTEGWAHTSPAPKTNDINCVHCHGQGQQGQGHRQRAYSHTNPHDGENQLPPRTHCHSSRVYVQAFTGLGVLSTRSTVATAPNGCSLIKSGLRPWDRGPRPLFEPVIRSSSLCYVSPN